MRGYRLIVRIHGARRLAAHIIEINTADSDVGATVAGPSRIRVDVGIDRRGVPGSMLCLHISDRVHVGVAVQFRDAADDVLVRGEAGRAGAGVGVDDYFELHVRVAADG